MRITTSFSLLRKTITDWFYFSFILGSSLQIENRGIINSSEEIHKELDYYFENNDFQCFNQHLHWYLESNLLDTEINLSDS